ncbi:MAG: glucosamine-6-phosphate deaminase [Bilifractor sp.]|jgi:glucosamine-6-phosphate deaminase
MRVIVKDTVDDVSKVAANIISAQMILNPKSVLGLPTGNTPIRTYDFLVRNYQSKMIDFSEVNTFNLDEYIGISEEDPNSYHYFMEKHLFSKVNINRENIHIPDGNCADENKACEEYDQMIEKKGGIDLQVLGLGQNGHIGFNEPDDHFSSGTHIISLTESTIRANSILFDSVNDVPRKAITMGVMNIMRAKQVLLIVTGAAKRNALQQMLHGSICPEVPASVLRFHPNVIVVADKEAA